MPNKLTHEHGYFRSHDGIKLFYSWEGPKGAPTILFCYGLVCSKLQWKYQMEHFKHNYRVLYMDYRGHNSSDVPTDYSTVTLETLAVDLATILDELGLESVPACGHSLGVSVLLEMYRLFPEKLSKMVLAHGTPKDPFESMFHHNFLQTVFKLSRMAYYEAPHVVSKVWKNGCQNALTHFLIAQAGFNTKYAKQKDISEYMNGAGNTDTGVFMSLLSDYTNYNACTFLEDIKIPTLLVGGDHDMITPLANQRIMHHLIPNSQLDIISEGSHSAQMEQPDLVIDIIEEFFGIKKRKERKISAPPPKKIKKGLRKALLH